ncbi:MAG: hypothetical protein LBI12_02500 [Treponema sp.]|jgi:hypothetical protein|nr:hypothetical protein [Treponema sp.]
MKRRLTLIIFLFFTVGCLAAQINVSGIFDSSVSAKVTGGDDPVLSFGIEEYANLRFQTRVGDNVTIFGAVNLLAAAGDYASIISPAMGFFAGDNYVAGIELERLYFRLRGEHLDFNGGLLRMPFGYGQVFGPSDFLNPRNPTKPDARPRAVLGAGLSWFHPEEDLKVHGFAAAPRNSSSPGSDGWIAGISGENHWDKLSVQALYSFELPKTGSENGIHRAGLSVKADIEAGIYIDTFYAYNHEAGTRHEGLSFSAGADYSFIDGKLIVIAEYLYNGETSSTYGGELNNNHYLYTGLTWLFSDYTNVNAALISSFDDISFTPIVTLSHDLFQGALLTVTAMLPAAHNEFSGWGWFFNCSVRLRLRF